MVYKRKKTVSKWQEYREATLINSAARGFLTRIRARQERERRNRDENEIIDFVRRGRAAAAAAQTQSAYFPRYYPPAAGGGHVEENRVYERIRARRGQPPGHANMRQSEVRPDSLGRDRPVISGGNQGNRAVRGYHSLITQWLSGTARFVRGDGRSGKGSEL